jgi:hypothetical protein
VFTARYALSPYIKQIRFVFKGLNRTVEADIYNRGSKLKDLPVILLLFMNCYLEI